MFIIWHLKVRFVFYLANQLSIVHVCEILLKITKPNFDYVHLTFVLLSFQSKHHKRWTMRENCNSQLWLEGIWYGIWEEIKWLLKRGKMTKEGSVLLQVKMHEKTWHQTKKKVLVSVVLQVNETNARYSNL